MHGAGILVLVVAAILAPILLVIAIGYVFSRWLARRNPKSQLIRKVTPLQGLNSLAVVVVLVVFTLMVQFNPTSTLGRLFAFPYGLIAVVPLAWLVSVVFAACVVIGRRIAKKHRGGV